VLHYLFACDAGPKVDLQGKHSEQQQSIWKQHKQYSSSTRALVDSPHKQQMVTHIGSTLPAI
jgi:hypothetical protein